MNTRPFLNAACSVLVLGLIVPSLCAQELLHELVSPTGAQNGRFGIAVSSVPDVDGDGVNDAVLGATGESGFGGRAHVFSGATGTPLYFVNGTVSGSSLLGLPSVGTPDLNGDGAGDFLVSEQVGLLEQVRVHSGADGAFLYTLTSPVETSGNFGEAMAGLGDLDGDGASEILIGAERDNVGRGEDAGQAYVYSGASGTLLYALVSPNKTKGGHFGSAVARVPDVNGDGTDDLLVGAAMESTLRHGSGRAYLFSGRNGALLREFDPPAPKKFGRFGLAVAGLGDVDGDGFGDVAVGAPFEDPPAGVDAGRAYIFSGASGTLLHVLESPNGELNGDFGISVARVPDVDNDGADDLLVGADREDPGSSPTDAGRAYLFSGASGALLFTLVSPHQTYGGFFGFAVSGMEDINGDRRGDLLVGAYFDGTDSAGRAYIFSGGSGAP